MALLVVGVFVEHVILKKSITKIINLVELNHTN